MKDELLARPMVSRLQTKSDNLGDPKPRLFAGHKEVGETKRALDIAQGALSTGQPHCKERVYGLESALSKNSKTL